MRCSMLIGLAAIACGGGATASPAQSPSPLGVVARIAGPDGGWDYASVDAVRRRVFVAHGDEVMAIEADTGRVTPAFARGAHLHAVVPVPGSDRIVTTNGGDSTAKVLSATDGKLIASVATPPDPDGAVFDAFTGDVAVVSGDPGTRQSGRPEIGAGSPVRSQSAAVSSFRRATERDACTSTSRKPTRSR